MSKRDLPFPVSPASVKASLPDTGDNAADALDYMRVEKRMPPPSTPKFHQTPRGRASFARLVGLL